MADDWKSHSKAEICQESRSKRAALGLPWYAARMININNGDRRLARKSNWNSIFATERGKQNNCEKKEIYYCWMCIPHLAAWRWADYIILNLIRRYFINHIKIITKKKLNSSPNGMGMRASKWMRRGAVRRPIVCSFSVAISRPPSERLSARFRIYWISTNSTSCLLAFRNTTDEFANHSLSTFKTTCCVWADRLQMQIDYLLIEISLPIAVIVHNRCRSRGSVEWVW